MRLLVIDHTAVLRSVRQRYVRLLRKSPIDLTLLAPNRWIENAVMVEYQPDPTETFPTVIGRVTAPGKEQRAFYLSGLVRAFRGSRPDVILMMEETFSLFGLQAVLLRLIFAPSAPIIFYSFNVVDYNRYVYRPSWFYRILGKVVGGACQVGLCPNDRAVQVLRQARIVGDVRKLFLGIDETMFVPIGRDEARQGIGVRHGCDLFLYAGRLFMLKGVQDLIEAFARLRSEHPERDMLLMIVGDGDYRDALVAKAAHHALGDSVLFRGAVPIEQVAAHICAATAFVLPSRSEWNEQFGRVNAEAMMLGTTIIGSTSGQIPTIIGQGGFIFQAGDVEDLKRTMYRALTDREEVERRRVVGMRKSMSEYSLAGFVDGLDALLTELSDR